MPAEESEIPQTARSIIGEVAAALNLMQARRPRVHCITNNVAAHFTANVLLAAGAVPSMTLSPEEIGAFVAGADALLVNLGTFDSERREAVAIAVGVAEESRKPWVLDPVFIDRSPDRAAFAGALAGQGPAIMRMNGAEYRALFAEEASLERVMARSLAARAVIAVSGDQDLVSDGRRIFTCRNGHEWLTRVTAIGCAQAALMAALHAVSNDALVAAAGGLLLMGIAGEMAAAKAAGPGSFAVHLVDALSAVDEAILLQSSRLG